MIKDPEGAAQPITLEGAKIWWPRDQPVPFTAELQSCCESKVGTPPKVVLSQFSNSSARNWAVLSALPPPRRRVGTLGMAILQLKKQRHGICGNSAQVLRRGEAGGECRSLAPETVPKPYPSPRRESEDPPLSHEGRI